MGLLAKLLELLDIDPAVQKAREKAWAGDVKGAIDAAQETITRSGPTAKRLDALSWFLTQAGRYEDALKASDQALALKPSAKYQATRARALRRLGRLDEALPLMQAQLKKDPMDIFNSSELCELLLDLNEPSAASAVFQSMKKMFGDESGSPLANKIGMTQAYESARARMTEKGLI